MWKCIFLKRQKWFGVWGAAVVLPNSMWDWIRTVVVRFCSNPGVYARGWRVDSELGHFALVNSVWQSSDQADQKTAAHAVKVSEKSSYFFTECPPKKKQVEGGIKYLYYSRKVLLMKAHNFTDYVKRKLFSHTFKFHWWMIITNMNTMTKQRKAVFVSLH